VRPHAATQTVVLDHTSLQRWASKPCCHVSRGPGPHLLAELSSDGATCFSAPDLASLSRWAPTLPRGPVLVSPRGELWCCHIPHVPQRAVDHRNKERHTCPRHVAGLACNQSAVACYRCGCKACGHVAIVRFNSATHAQLTTPGYGYSGDTTRHDGTTTLTMFSIAG
jgi:hypothetical protein